MDKLEHLSRKILALPGLERQLAIWRFKEEKIVFTNGCFDLLHLGHVDYLARAASLGDRLVIGLNSDASVSRLKGPHRPILPQDSRALVLAALQFVSAVVLFDQDTPFDLIGVVRPDFLVKGGDYRPDEVVGAGIVRENGGNIVILPFVPGYSTSSIEGKILQAGKNQR